jgi:hypothetical protein
MRYNTNNPLGTYGSSDPRDLYDNAGNLDLGMNSLALSFIDRLGTQRRTYKGFETNAQAIIDAMGMYRLADQTFGTGTTITSNKQLLLWSIEDGGTGFYYFWSAQIPPGGKVVPEDSSPISSGGEGPGGWLAWDDLEQRLATGIATIGESTAASVGALANGVVIAAEYLIATATPSGAIAAAIAAAGSKTVYIGSQFEGLDVSGIILNAGQTVFGHGVNLITTANNFSFALNVGCTIHGINVSSPSGKNSGLTNQNAFFVPSSLMSPISRTKVFNVKGKGLGGALYKGNYLVNNHEGNIFTLYEAESCNILIDANERHEYLNAGMGSASLCNTALRVQGGNINATGMVVSDCGLAIDVVAGSNDAHGQIVGGVFNHNLQTVRVKDTANGFLFLGCQFFNGGPIELDNCHDVWFRSCVLNAIQIIEDGCTRCGFTQCDFLDGIDNVPNANGNPSEVFYLDNRLPSGTPLSGVDALNGGLLRLQVNTNITTIPTGVSSFQWPVITSNAITGNAAYTVQQFYAAGNPFVRGDTCAVRYGAALNFNTQMTFGKAASAAWNASELKVYLRNSSGDIVGRLLPDSQASSGASNLITYSLVGTLARSAIETVIENNSGGLLTLYRQQNGTPVQTYMNVTNW